MKKVLRIINLNMLLIKSNLNLRQKAQAFLSQATGVINLIFGKKELNYLGQKLTYDNPSTIFTLQLYPYEIGTKISANINEDIKSILDIGGNIGQFSISAAKVLSSTTRIDSFEPNPEVYKYLEKNTRGIENINTYNYAIGSGKKLKLFYVPNKSAKGSIIRENATNEDEEVKEIEIQVIQNVNKVTQHSNYDLLKIDVEGYEYEALKNLEGVNFKYAFIEVSGPKREKNYFFSELANTIRKKWGDFDILYQSQVDANSEAYDILLKKIN